MTHHASPLLLLAATLATGCASLTRYEQPLFAVPQQTIPAANRSLVLVNNAVEQPERSGAFLLFANGREQRMVFPHDSTTFPMLDMLGQQLLETEWMTDVRIFKTAMRSDSLFRSPRTLPLDSLRSIYGACSAEWLLSLDALPWVLTVKEVPLAGDERIIMAEMNIAVYPTLSLYHAGDTVPRLRYTTADTTRWRSTQFDFASAIELLPPMNECLDEALYNAAERMLKTWLPTPTAESRTWVDYPGAVMREARTFFNEGDAESAAIMMEYGWEKSSSKAMRYWSAYDRALLAEQGGQLADALLWLDRADSVGLDAKHIARIHAIPADSLRASLKRQIADQRKLSELIGD